MRELRGAGVVQVRHISGEANPADLFTKVLAREPFEKHRKFVMNLPGDTGAELGKRHALERKTAAGAAGGGDAGGEKAAGSRAGAS